MIILSRSFWFLDYSQIRLSHFCFSLGVFRFVPAAVVVLEAFADCEVTVVLQVLNVS